MEHFYGRTVFFVSDAERALAFYTQTLGFSLDWNHRENDRAYVFQVSLFGFALILNQTDDRTAARAGHGRAFLGLEDDQIAALRQHIQDHSITTSLTHWGAPTLSITDLDSNELFVWLPRSEWPELEAQLRSSQQES